MLSSLTNSSDIDTVHKNTDLVPSHLLSPQGPKTNNNHCNFLEVKLRCAWQVQWAFNSAASTEGSACKSRGCADRALTKGGSKQDKDGPGGGREAETETPR